MKEGKGVPERGESCGVWFWVEVSPFGSMGCFTQKQRFLALLCETFLREESESFSMKPIKGFEITSECEQQSPSDNISLSLCLWQSLQIWTDKVIISFFEVYMARSDFDSVFIFLSNHGPNLIHKKFKNSKHIWLYINRHTIFVPKLY